MENRTSKTSFKNTGSYINSRFNIYTSKSYDFNLNLKFAYLNILRKYFT